MKKSIALILFVFLFSMLPAQESMDSSKLDFHGYLSGMPSLLWSEDETDWQVLIHNRLNFDWFLSDHINSSIQFRNQFIAGEFVKENQVDNGFYKENYYLPLTFQQKFENQYMLSLSIDRVWLQYTYDKLEVKLGRQRINWGQTFVWNPNDLFNSYNFFDFDYPERPGADALRVQYYTSFTSSIDLAAKVDSAGNITTGGLFRFNRWNTDFQVLGAYFSQSNKLAFSPLIPPITWNDNDLVGGFGVSGAIHSLSIRSEMSYFHSLNANSDSTNQLLASLTLDYSFSNETYLMFEFFYNSNVQLSGNSLTNLSTGTQHVKTLAFTKYNAFGQVSYPLNPLVNTTFAGMYFFDENLMGFYAGPSIEVSMTDNLSLSAFFQFFAFRYENPLTQKEEWTKSYYAFLRLKWNF